MSRAELVINDVTVTIAKTTKEVTTLQIDDMKDPVYLSSDNAKLLAITLLTIAKEDLDD